MKETGYRRHWQPFCAKHSPVNYNKKIKEKKINKIDAMKSLGESPGIH